MTRQGHIKGQGFDISDNQSHKENGMRKTGTTRTYAATALLGVLLVSGCATSNTRRDANIYEPEFLTRQLKRQNLLVNASFEDTNSLAWTVVSWRSCKDAGRIMQIDKAHDGKCVAYVTNGTNQFDLVSVKQTVRVKPKTKYLFSGWAKWEDVTIGENCANGRRGVNLGLEGTWERSDAMLEGTKDWTYLTFIFDSGDRTVVDVAAKLGHWTSGATGKVWFDDMCLVELPGAK